MQTLAFFNQKGGAGKTTCTMLVADALHKRGNKVLVVDTDPQRSALKWEQRAVKGSAPFPVRVEAISGIALPEFAAWLQKRIVGLDYLLIDTPPNLHSQELRTALFIADLAILPLIPHAAFIDALEELKPVVKLVEQERGRPLPIRALVNRYSGRRLTERTLASSINEALTWRDEGITWPVFNTQLKDLVAFADAYNYRTSVYELSGSKPACQALDALVEELQRG